MTNLGSNYDKNRIFSFTYDKFGKSSCFFLFNLFNYDKFGTTYDKKVNMYDKFVKHYDKKVNYL